MTETPTHTPLPCPFCGAKALIGQTFDNAWYAMCEVDHCIKIESYWRTEAEALAAWNTRPDTHAKLVEALESAVDQYGKPGGPWNVLSDPGSWLERARAALKEAGRG